jgi:Zn-dependent hydrolases, including glyoxylases
MGLVIKTGKVNNVLYVLGTSEVPIYLLDIPGCPVVFDSGVTCMGKIYTEAIRSVLGERQPAILFLTHSHWDHCGAAAILKKSFPAMQVAASPKTANVLKRPHALDLMARFNCEIYNTINLDQGLQYSDLTDEAFEPFLVDRELTDEEIISLTSDTAVQVLETPGHTRDHLSFFLPREKILIASESGGVMIGSGAIEPEFVADYNLYLASLQRLAGLPAEIVCQGHFVVITGRAAVTEFFTHSMNETINYKSRILAALEMENGDRDRVIRLIKAERFDNVKGFKQEESSYLLNLTAQVKHLATHWL